MAASTINTDFIRKHPAQTVLTVLGLSGVVLIFLPYVNVDRWYVPVVTFLEGLEERNLFMIAFVGPFVVLPLFISAGYLRWVLTGGLSPWEGRLGYTLALLVVAPFLLLVIQAWWESDLLKDWDLFVFPALGLGAGGWFIIQEFRHGAPRTLTGLVAMQLVYLPFAVFWLASLIGALIGALYVKMSDVGVGAYLVPITVIVYTVQAALSVHGQPQKLFRLLPLVLVWVPWVGLCVWAWLEG